jgi:hypothetical protein
MNLNWALWPNRTDTWHAGTMLPGMQMIEVTLLGGRWLFTTGDGTRRTHTSDPFATADEAKGEAQRYYARAYRDHTLQQFAI